jgi:hypothetical protein
MSNTRKLKEEIISAGEHAVKELIKVAKEPIVTGDMESDLAADRLKNAAAAKRLAIMDAFDILRRIDEERNMLASEDSVVSESITSTKGFAERRSK